MRWDVTLELLLGAVGLEESAAQMLPTCGQALCMDVAWRPKEKDVYIDTDSLKNLGSQIVLYLPDDMGHAA